MLKLDQIIAQTTSTKDTSKLEVRANSGPNHI